MLFFLLKWLKYLRLNKPIIHTNIVKQIFSSAQMKKFVGLYTENPNNEHTIYSIFGLTDIFVLLFALAPYLSIQ